MDNKTLSNVISFIRPGSIYVLRNDKLEWFDENQTEPTKAEIEAGFIAYQSAKAAEAEALANSKADLLARLGITAEEAKLLLA